MLAILVVKVIICIVQIWKVDGGCRKYAVLVNLKGKSMYRQYKHNTDTSFA